MNSGVPREDVSVPPWFDRIEATATRISGYMALASGAVFLPLAFYMTIDAVSRRVGGPFTAVSDEIASYTLAFGGTWALAFALSSGAHVRIDVLLRIYSPTARAIADLVAVATACCLSAVLAVETWQLAFTSYTMNARSFSMLGAPLAVPQALTAVGFSMLTVQAIVMCGARLLRSGCRGGRATGSPGPEGHSPDQGPLGPHAPGR